MSLEFLQRLCFYCPIKTMLKRYEYIMVFASGLLLGLIISYYNLIYHSKYLHAVHVHTLNYNVPESISTYEDIITSSTNMESNQASKDPNALEDIKINANNMTTQARIFCMILTMPKSHRYKADHVKATWLKRCDNYVFTSSAVDKTLPAIDLKLNVTESRSILWGKYKYSMQYLYDNHLNDYDFFLKADDDTYFIMENVRYMLQDAKATDLAVWGHRFKKYAKNGYVSGGSGYIMTREVVKLFVTKGIHKDNASDSKNGLCPAGIKGSGDVKFGQCLNSLNVTFMDTRDELGRERFYPDSLQNHVNSKFLQKKSWLKRYNMYPNDHDKNPNKSEKLSKFPISFHYTSNYTMYTLEYLLYGVQIHNDFSNFMYHNKL